MGVSDTRVLRLPLVAPKLSTALRCTYYFPFRVPSPVVVCYVDRAVCFRPAVPLGPRRLFVPRVLP